MTDRDRQNNFDLIRLFAALQVVLFHIAAHLGVDPTLGPLWYFPGVIIFFVISGYLVYGSYERSPGLKFATNRALRIYPGLWVCLLVTAASMAILGRLTDWTHPKIATWLIAHATLFQFYDDPYFASWGAGGVSGALWTISVELQFYLFVPLLARLLAVRNRNAVLFTIGVASLAVNIASARLLPMDSFLNKLIRVSLAPYLFYFCLGVGAQVNWSRWRTYFEGKAAAWIAVYAVYVMLAMWTGLRASYFPNHWELLGVLLLAGLTLSCAFTARSLGRMLRGHDLSYGIYLYHMPVIGILIELGLRGVWWSAPMAIALTILVAFASWNMVERPALGLKSRTRRPLLVAP